jgi:hypothetical protein
MRYLIIFALFALFPLLTYGQIIKSSAIMELNNMDYSAPCASCSDWRFSRVDNKLYRWSGTQWQHQDLSLTNEFQVLSVSNDTIFLSNGGFVKIPTVQFGGTQGELAFYDSPSTLGSMTIGSGLTVSGDTLSVTPQVLDSTRLVQDSILVYYQDSLEVGRDTISIQPDNYTITGPPYAVDTSVIVSHAQATNYSMDMRVNSTWYDLTLDTLSNEGRLEYNATNGTLQFGMDRNVPMEVGQSLYNEPMVNGLGILLPKGTVLMVDTSQYTQGNRLRVMPANASLPPDLLVGIAAEDIQINQEGFVVWFGNITSTLTILQPIGETWAQGDLLYPHPTQIGRLTNVLPFNGKIKIPIAVIKAINGNNVLIKVRMRIGEYLRNITDVDLTSPVNGSNLFYENGLWKDTLYTYLDSIVFSVPNYMSVSPTTLSNSGTVTFGFQPQSSNTFFAGPTSGPNAPPAFRTLSQADVNIAGGVTGAGSAGQVAFYNGLYTQTGSNNLFWDNANGRLGIGTTTPTAPLDVTGSIRLFNSTVPRFNIQDQTGVNNGNNFNLSVGPWVNNSRQINFDSYGKTVFIIGSDNFNNTGSGHVTIGRESLAMPALTPAGYSLGIRMAESKRISIYAARPDNTLNTNNQEFLRLGSNTYGTYTFFRVDDLGNLFSRGSAVFGSETSSGARLHVQGSSNTNTADALLVEASDGVDLFEVENGGRISVGKDVSGVTQSTATIRVISGDTNTGIAIVPKGTGAITAAVPDAGIAGGIARGANAIDLQTLRVNGDQVASGSNSVIAGGRNNRATGSNSVVSGGADNASTGFASVVSGGNGNTASGGYSIVGSGNGNTATSSFCFVGSGNGNSATASGASVLGGENNTATALNASVTGGFRGRAYLYAQRVQSGGSFSVVGDNQRSDISLRRDTISGTAQRELFLDGASLRAILTTPTGNTARIWNARIQCVATVTVQGTNGPAVGSSYVQTFDVGIKRIGSTTTLIGGTPIATSSMGDAAMSGATFIVTADDTNDALKVEFQPPTGTATNTEIRAVATIYLTELGY